MIYKSALDFPPTQSGLYLVRNMLENPECGSRCKLYDAERKIWTDSRGKQIVFGTTGRVGDEWSDYSLENYKEITLLPIEQDDIFKSRDYIPLLEGWEIQTKGSGSSFRICKTYPDGRYDRKHVLDDELHKFLVNMSMDQRKGIESLLDRIELLEDMVEFLTDTISNTPTEAGDPN